MPGAERRELRKRLALTSAHDPDGSHGQRQVPPERQPWAGSRRFGSAERTAILSASRPERAGAAD